MVKHVLPYGLSARCAFEQWARETRDDDAVRIVHPEDGSTLHMRLADRLAGDL
jgi:hypothetical protein